MLAIENGVAHFRFLLLPTHFTVYCDNQAAGSKLKNVSNDATPRIIRWQLFLNPYKFDVKHIAGTSNFLADFLSRNGNKGHSNDEEN